MKNRSKAKINGWKHKLRNEFMNECRKAKDFDYSFLFRIEQVYLKRLKYSIDNQEYVDSDPKKMKYLKYAIWCLDIINNEDKYNKFHIINGPDGKIDFSQSYSQMTVPTNLRNCRKYCSTDDEYNSLKDKFKYELYMRKAISLYHRIRQEHITEWWW